ncbi:MAG: 3-isopropylmalate dehydrogenase [Vulcanimicrobiaceae bacterium]
MPRVAVLPGDGIGPEVTSAAVQVLAAVRSDIEFDEYLFGGSALALGFPAFPRQTREACETSDAVLFGAAGDARFDRLPAAERPERALLALRRHFGLYANIRPVKALRGATAASPLRPEVLGESDFVIVRELSSGLYYGEPKRQFVEHGVRSAVDTLSYDEREIRRILTVAFETARRRRRHLTSVDKSNVLETSRLWREIVNEMSVSYADITVQHMLVDTAAMQIVCNPRRFDVVVTENTFGDSLSDEAAAVSGSIGVLPSASLGESTNSVGGFFGLYEPIAGSAPDIAGTDRANPIGAMLSGAMLLEHSLGDASSAKRITVAIEQVLESGIATPDLPTAAGVTVTTSRFTALVLDALAAIAAT